VLRAEWTKLRTLPGSVIALIAAAALTVAFGLLTALGTHTSCPGGPCPDPPTGPGGQVVTDSFSFAHRPLDGDGTLTARVTSMTGIITYPPPNNDEIVHEMVPWAKAGLMIKDGTKPGSAYASVLLTAAHGVRMQHNFTGDVAGPPGARWLRLDRKGDTITGYASADGSSWTKISAVRLEGLPRQVQIGLFVASPSNVTAEANGRGGRVVKARFTQATGVFDQVGPGDGWTFDEVGRSGEGTDWEKFHQPAGLRESGGSLTLSGSGDIAPAGRESGPPLDQTVAGLFAALFVVIAVGAMFITAEYRRGLIRTTLIATPRRHRTVLAKAAVMFAATFATGAIAALVTLPISLRLLRAGGNFVAPVDFGIALRIVVGCGLVLSLAALLAYGTGVVLRRGIAAVACAVLLVVVPNMLATSSVVPDEAARWLLRVTPAAGFAILQSIPAYAQVQYPYAPADGYFPLAPWAGLAVMALWAAAFVGLGVVRIRRGDA
jgi:ABC-type transport system involved in multi-copper enzyme maturation permease subunit